MASIGEISSSCAFNLARNLLCSSSERLSIFSTSAHLLTIALACRAPNAVLERSRVAETTSTAFAEASITVSINLNNDFSSFCGNAKLRPNDNPAMSFVSFAILSWTRTSSSKSVRDTDIHNPRGKFFLTSILISSAIPSKREISNCSFSALFQSPACAASK